MNPPILPQNEVKQMYLIIEDNLPIGFFTEKVDRDNAFVEYFLKDNRFGIKQNL